MKYYYQYILITIIDSIELVNHFDLVLPFLGVVQYRRYEHLS